MNILFLSGHYPPNTKGGGELSTHLIARGLVERGHQVTVITEGATREDVVLEGVAVHRRPWPFTAKPLLEKRASRKLARLIKAELEGKLYDIIHAHDFRTALALSELELPNAVVTARDYAQICGTTNNILVDGTTCHCTVRDLLHTQRLEEAGAIRKLFRLWQYRYNISYRKHAFQTYKQQVFISHAQQAVIAEQQDLTHIHTSVMYNPIDPAYLTQATKKGVHGSFVYVGTVEQYKGVGVLLAAWQLFVKAYPQARLRIVGEGAQKKDYQQWVQRRGLQYHVSFVDRVPPHRLMNIYDESCVVVAPHIWVEPFGRTVIEAMAREKIVVAANHGGPAEVVQAHKTGLLFEKNSVIGLVDALKEAITLPELPRRDMQQAARRWVQENLSTARIGEQHEALYRSITPPVTH